MKALSPTQYHLRLALFASLALFVFRLALAAITDFWCDELCWIGLPSFTKIFQVLLADPAPHIFLDPVLIRLENLAFLPLGLSPEITVRLHSVTYSILTGLLPFFSGVISARRKWLWFAWCALHVGITHMAINTRCYAGMIFYASCTLFAFLEGSAQEPGKTSKALIFYVLLSALAPLQQAFLVFPTFFLMLFLFFKKPSHRRLAFILGSSLLVSAVWFVFLRHRTGGSSSARSAAFFTQLADAPLIEITKQILGCFSNPGKRSVIVAPLAALGAWYVLKRARKLGLFFLACIAAGALLPVLLVVKFGYHFQPRQTWGALPFFGWFLVEALNLFARKTKPQFRPYFLGIFFFGIGVLPLVNFMLNRPPFVDQTPRRISKALKAALPDGGTVIVLNHCETLSTRLVVDANFRKAYFQNLLIGLETPEPQLGSQVRAWQNSDETCFGKLAEEPDDASLLKEIQATPEKFLVLGMHGIRTPEALSAVKCIDERGESCLR